MRKFISFWDRIRRKKLVAYGCIVFHKMIKKLPKKSNEMKQIIKFMYLMKMTKKKK